MIPDKAYGLVKQLEKLLDLERKVCPDSLEGRGFTSWMDLDVHSDQVCSDGVKNDSYDYYELCDTCNGVGFILVKKENHENDHPC